jgi:hypothetical protein
MRAPRLLPSSPVPSDNQASTPMVAAATNARMKIIGVECAMPKLTAAF